jgi:hypothetical protein
LTLRLPGRAGLVRDSVSLQPIAGARVHLRANPSTPIVLTGTDGRFILPPDGFPPSGTFQVSVGNAHDPAAPTNCETGVASASADADIAISLRPVPVLQNPAYQPPDAIGCSGCHVEQRQQWLQSNYAMAASNVLVRDLCSGDGTGPATRPSGRGYVFINSHPSNASGFCATCHAPNERPSDPGGVRCHKVAAVAGQDGVTCTRLAWRGYAKVL